MTCPLAVTAVFFGLLVTLAHVLGVLTAIHAIMRVRTAQGAIAWAVLLVALPYVALPLYWVFGRNRFYGYANARRSGDLEIHHLTTEIGKQAPRYLSYLTDTQGSFRALEALAHMPFTRGNAARLLVNGDATFEAIFGAIESASEYVLVQFFIIHDDRIGRALADRLVAAAGRGIAVYLLYDEIGSKKLPKGYVERLRDAGCEVHRFGTTRGRWNRFQLNFRNHRKIVVVDGQVAFVGGHNVGDEYLGQSPRFGPWRDTHVAVHGPSVQGVQLAFVEDWWWATRTLPPLDWTLRQAVEDGVDVLVLPSGPADDLETCGLMYVHAIHAATRRLWIASPYFVPDSDVVSALQLAALRGVDVRVILPKNPDHKLVYLAAFSFLEDTDRAGVKIYRYKRGFMHHKVFVVDDLAAVGTANLDNRSFRLNFEITLLFADAAFANEVAGMLERDLADCELATPEDLERRPFPFRIAVRLARLLAPIQ